MKRLSTSTAAARSIVAAATLALPMSLLIAACGDDLKEQPDADAMVAIDAAAADAAADAADATPAIASVDYPVIAHNGRLVLTGSNLEGTTEVTIGGVSHTNLADVGATLVTVESVSDQVVVGTADVIAVSAAATSAPFEAIVIHLVINEIDPDTPGADVAEFIELDTGLAQAVSLDGYVIALFNGNTVQGDTLAVLDLDADTAVTGLHLVGPATLGVTPQVIFDGPIQAGEDGAGVYQFAGATATFPATFGDAGVTGLIDAVIWESNADDDSASIEGLLLDDIVIDEGATSPEREIVGIGRCPGLSTLRTGAVFALAAPTPGVANAECP